MKKVLTVILVLMLLLGLHSLALTSAAAGGSDVIVFTDPVLEEMVRKQMGKPEGDIAVADAEAIDQLDLHHDTKDSGDPLITDITSLKYFKNLFMLALYNNDIADISALEGMEGLKFLDLGGNRVTDLSPLSKLPLEELILWDNQITDLSPLAPIATLRNLQLQVNLVNDFGPLGDLTGLQYLYVGGNATLDYTPLAAVLPNLQERDFEILTTPFDTAEVIAFTDPVLEALVREKMGNPEGDITAGDAANVRDLNLEMNPDDWSIPRISNLDGMQYFVNLVTLDLGWALDAGGEQVDLAPLSGLVKLERLTLQCDGIRDVSALSGLTNMRELWIWGNNEISDISALAALTQMESIWIFGDQISDISVLANMPNLYRVLMADNRVTDLYPLAGLNNLTALELQNNPIWDNTQIASIYPQLTQKDFDINDTPAYTRPENPDEVIVLNDPVLEQKIREALGIPEGDITAGDAARLQNLYADVDQNAPDEERIHDITALKYFVNLQVLVMNGNAITDIAALEGLMKLDTLWLLGVSTYDLQPLVGLSKLTRLGFNGGMEDVNFIGNMPELEELRIDGLRNLPADLPQLQNLTIFCSLGGELTDISLLAQVPTLTVIDLSWNMVSDVTPLANLPLTELYLSGCPVEDYSPLKELYPNLVGRSFEIYELAEPENPSEVIVFADPVLEQKVREALGKPDGDITARDAAQVTTLNIGNEWQERIPEDTIAQSLDGLQSFINLRELDLSFNAISDLTPIAGLTELKKLNLGGNDLVDLSPLSGLNQMEDLILFGNRYADISPLANLTSLRSLHIGGSSIGNIEALAGLVLLDGLYLERCALEDISPLQGMTNMFSLDLRDNYITDLSVLAGMQNLHFLQLSNNPIADYTPIETIYPNLQEKDFELGQVYDVEVPLKAEQPDAEVTMSDGALEGVLRDVTRVYERPLTQKDLAGIGKLIVGDNAMWRDVRDLSALAYCLNLEGLVIDNSQVSDLTPLSNLTKLRGIHISDSQISDLTPLAGLQTLTVLEFSGNLIEDISALQSLPRLERLELTVNCIADFSPLYGLENLQKLFIQYNATEDVTGLKELAGRLQEKDFDPKQPLELDLTRGFNQEAENTENADPQEQQGQQFNLPEDPDHVIVFADPVLELRIRKQLELPEGDITAKIAAGVNDLFINNEWQESYAEGSQFSDLSGLEYFINLKTLDISCNLVTNIDILAQLPTLEHFRAFSNQIIDLTPLANLSKLYNVNVAGNKVTDLTPLSGLTGLKELNLDGNQITDYSPIESIYPQLQQKDFELD